MELERVALGQLGISPEEYKDYNLGDLTLKYEGWRELQDNLQRESWERARMIAYYAASGNLKKGTKPKDLFRNPYIKEKVREPIWISRKEFERRVKRTNELKYTVVNG